LTCGGSRCYWRRWRWQDATAGDGVGAGDDGSHRFFPCFSSLFLFFFLFSLSVLSSLSLFCSSLLSLYPFTIRIFISCHVVFDESVFPSLSTAQPSTFIPTLSPPSDDLSSITVPLIIGSTHHQPSCCPLVVSCPVPRSPSMSSYSGSEATALVAPSTIPQPPSPTNTSDTAHDHSLPTWHC